MVRKLTKVIMTSHCDFFYQFFLLKKSSKVTLDTFHRTSFHKIAPWLTGENFRKSQVESAKKLPAVFNPRLPLVR